MEALEREIGNNLLLGLPGAELQGFDPILALIVVQLCETEGNNFFGFHCDIGREVVCFAGLGGERCGMNIVFVPLPIRA